MMHYIIFSVNKNCLPPSIDIGLHKNPYETEDPIKGRFMIKLNITKNRCNEKVQTTRSGCSGTSISKEQGLFINFRSIADKWEKNVFVTTTRYLELRGAKNKLAYIVCYVRLEVNNKFHGENYDYGYIQLNENKIVAKLRGPDFVIRGMKVLLFDAYKSYHTLLPWVGYHNLNFSWTLMQRSLYSQVNSSLLPAMFGDGVKVTFNISDLNSTTYNILLFVSDGRKNATAKKQVQILDKPKVYIRYEQKDFSNIKRLTQ